MEHRKAKLLVATGQNHLAMNRTVAQIAWQGIQEPYIPEALLRPRWRLTQAAECALTGSIARPPPLRHRRTKATRPKPATVSAARW